MSALATREPAAATPRPATPRARRSAEPLLGRGATLEDAVLDAWEGLAARGRAECLVCGGSTSGQVCDACGSSLS